MGKYWDILIMSFLCSLVTLAAAMTLIAVVALLVMEWKALL